MRYCPSCQTVYHDDTVRFCLQDGATLVAAGPGHDPDTTLVRPHFPAPPTQVVPLARPTTPPSAPQQARTGVGLKIGVALLALALVGVAGLFVARELTRSSNNGGNTASAEQKVTDTLNAWAGALQARDLEAYLSHYADRLEVFYRQRNWSLAQVRENKANAFAQYYAMSLSISDLRVNVEASGQRAVATFTKSYNFKGNKDFVGSTRSELTFSKTTEGRWLIVGERDL